jgi:hypothetical protein
MSKITDERMKILFKDKTARHIWKKIDQVLHRLSDVSDKDIWFDHLYKMIIKYKLPVEKLDEVPDTAIEIGKSRFDQIYDMCSYLAFPPYKEKTVMGFMGPDVEGEALNTKIWRCYFNEELEIQSVLIRATSFQEAFAKASDYGARVYLKLNKIVPRDMTIRVVYVTNTEVVTINNIRRMNRNKTRKLKGLKEAEKIDRHENGIVVAALSHQNNPEYSIYKYIEKKDLKDLALRGIRRISFVEAETYFVAEEERKKQKGRSGYKEPL